VQPDSAIHRHFSVFEPASGDGTSRTQQLFALQKPQKTALSSQIPYFCNKIAKRLLTESNDRPSGPFTGREAKRFCGLVANMTGHSILR
jgi:hypothetical protein